MQILITGTDTDIGKTLVCSWLCVHTGYAYFKPIQTGISSGRDAAAVGALAGVKIYPEVFAYKEPLSPHLAAKHAADEVIIEQISLPPAPDLIVEGVGGVLVPLNARHLLRDLIVYLKLPVIVVASTRLGTINHTLLTLEALRQRQITILGVIMHGPENLDNQEAIEFYGQTTVLAHLPWLTTLARPTLQSVPLSSALKELLSP